MEGTMDEVAGGVEEMGGGRVGVAEVEEAREH